MLVVGLFYAFSAQAYTCQELENYVELIKNIDQALTNNIVDSAIVAEELDVVQVLELFDDIRSELSAYDVEIVDKAIEHINSQLILVKAPRPNPATPIVAETVEQGRYYLVRDITLRDLTVTGTLIAPNFASQFLRNNGDTTTGDITYSNQAATVYQGSKSNFAVSVSAPELVADSYSLTLPVLGPTSDNQALVSNAEGQLSFVAIAQGIQSINTATCENQFLTTSTQSITLGWSQIGSSTNILNIPYAGNLPNDSSSVGLITGADYFNLVNASTIVQVGTPNNVPNTLALRDATGSFQATTITVTTVVFDALNGGSITLEGPDTTTLDIPYIFKLPVDIGTPGQALTTDGANPAQLVWSSAIATTSGIQSINLLTGPDQRLVTGTLGIVPNWTTASPSTQILNIPQASTSGVTSGLISNTDYTYFSDKVDRSGDTITGPLIMTSTLVMANCNEMIFNNTDDTLNISLKAPCPTVSPSTIITIQLPSVQATQQFQVLGNVSNPTTSGQLGWITTVTSQQAINWLYTATTSNIANTLVLRDGSGNFSAGTITANLTGTATYATNAGSSISTVTAQFFTGPLLGDVTGTQEATVVSYVGGQTAASVAAATILANNATSADVPNQIVKRNASGSFAATTVTVTTVAFEAKDTSGTVSITGPATVAQYAVTLPSAQGGASQTLINDGSGNLSWQTVVVGSAIESLNTVTVVNQFLTTSTAGTLVGWTDNATTGVHQLTIPYAGNLLGTSSVGLISGIDFQEFLTSYTTTQAGTPNNTPNTLVRRDALGNFAASQVTVQNLVATNPTNQLTLGSGSNTVTLSAQSLTQSYTFYFPNLSPIGTATFLMTNGNQTINGQTTFNNNVIVESPYSLQFADPTGNNYVGIQTPTSPLGSSYTFSLPPVAPGPLQVLLSSTVAPYTATNWSDLGGAPALTLYVAINGNDAVADGSFNNPYRTLRKAVSKANTLATVATPVTIKVGAGTFIEDLTSGPIEVTAAPVSIKGSASNTTIFTSLTTSQTFLYLPATTRVEDIIITSSGSSLLLCGIAVDASGVTYPENNVTSLYNVAVFGCQTGFNLTGLVGGGSADYLLNGCSAQKCTYGVKVNNCRAVLYNNTLAGVDLSMGNNPTPANTGLLVTGSTVLIAESTAFLYCSLAAEISDASNVQIIGGAFTSNVNAVECNSGSATVVEGASFISNSGTNISATDVNTTLEVTACNMDGLVNMIQTGTGLITSNGALVNISSSSLNNLVDGIIAGMTVDASPATVLATAVSLGTCTDKQIIQNDSATIVFVGGVFNESQIIINSPSTSSFNAANSNDNYSTLIGKFANVTQDIIVVGTSEVTPPALTYQLNYNGSSGLVLINQTGDNTMLGVEVTTANDAQLSAVTTENNQAALVQLYSGNIGSIPPSQTVSNSNILGWELKKTGLPTTTIPVQAALAANFMNNDLTLTPTISKYTSFYVDGFANTFNFPAVNTTYLPTYTTTRLVWAQDTNLYRAAAGLLKTDGNLAIGGLVQGSTGQALIANTNNVIQTSVTSATELGYVHGVTAPIQGQFALYLPLAGGVMTGALTLPQSTSPYPPLNFGSAPGSTTGFAAPSGVLTLITSGSPRILVDANGGVTMNAAIGETTLTVTGGGAAIYGNLTIPSGSGRIITDAITINNAPVNPTDGTNKAYVDSIAVGLAVKNPCQLVDVLNTATFGFPTIDSVVTTTDYRVLLINESNPVFNGIWQIGSGGLWSRPTDFPSGGNAANAYTLIQQGAVYANSSWICTNTVDYATIDTDPLYWSEFSSPQNITGANLGTGVGIYAGKVGNTLDFYSLNPGSNISIVQSPVNEITIGLSPNPSVSSLTATGLIQSTGGTVEGVTLTDGAGTTITGGTVTANNIIASNGTALNPSISFIASSTTGLYSPIANTLAISTAGLERLQINSSGTITIPAFTPAGVVHNDGSGNLFSSGLITSDFSNANVVPNSALQTLTTPGLVANSATTATSLDVLNTIVSRDGSTGGFYAGIVTATAFVAGNGTTALPSITFSQSPGAGLSTPGAGPNAGELDISSGGVAQIVLNSSGTHVLFPLLTTGIAHLDSAGTLSSSPVALNSGDVSGVLPIANGGTGTNSLGTNAILTSNASSALAPINLTNGQILIGSTGASPVANTITQASPNQVIVTNAAGSITLATPQDIGILSSPTFFSETLSKQLTITSVSNQIVLVLPGLDQILRSRRQHLQQA